MAQGFLQKEKERKLQYQWYHNFHSYLAYATQFDTMQRLSAERCIR